MLRVMKVIYLGKWVNKNKYWYDKFRYKKVLKVPPVFVAKKRIRHFRKEIWRIFWEFSKTYLQVSDQILKVFLHNGSEKGDCF